MVNAVTNYQKFNYIIFLKKNGSFGRATLMLEMSSSDRIELCRGRLMRVSQTKLNYFFYISCSLEERKKKKKEKEKNTKPTTNKHHELSFSLGFLAKLIQIVLNTITKLVTKAVSLQWYP